MNDAPSETAGPPEVLPAARPAVSTPEVPKLAPTSREKAFQKLDPRSVTVEQISSVIFSICVAGFAAVGMGIWLLAEWPPGWPFWLGTGIAVSVIGFFFWLSFAWPAADYRRQGWRLDESGLEIRRGIFWRREITVPRARVQHTDVRQGPLQRQYGVAKLVIHTAGTEAPSIELNGLSLPIAQWLRDELIGELKGKSDAV